jgi:hypothetical protein
MEAFFHAPVIFEKAHLSAVANSALAKFGKYGLQANQIFQRMGDQLFDYELSFSLFNNQAQVRLVAERLFVNLQSARGKQDAELVLECLVSAIECLGADVVKRFIFQAVSHAAFDSETYSQEFFAPFADKDKNIIGGGRIVMVKEDAWPSPVRLAFEKSLGFKNDVFLNWSIEQSGTVNLEVLKEMADKFGVSAQNIGLELRFE